MAVQLRASVSNPAERKAKRSVATRAAVTVLTALDTQGQNRFAALKAWRGEVARAHNLPAYVIFHDATLAAIAAREPRSLAELQGISGIGAKKLEAYGPQVLQVMLP